MRKVCVYGIARNEIANVAEWINQFHQADYIVVVDTGSNDGTIEKMRHLASRDKRIHFHAIQCQPFRFDTARNVALNLVPVEADVAFTVDFDERVSDNWYDVLSRSTFEGTASIRLIFSETNGEPAITYPRTSVSAKADHVHWRYAVHEVLMCGDNATPAAHLDIDVRHIPDSGKDRTFYLELMHTMLEEYPDEPRSYQYLGREFYYQNDPFQAIQYLKRHIEIEPYGPHRSETAALIAESYIMMDGSLEGALDEAESWLLRAASEFMHRAPLIRLANLYRQCGRYESALGMIDMASHVERPDAVMVVEDYLYRWQYIVHLKATVEYQMGRVEQAQQTIAEFLKEQKPNTTYPAAFMKDVALIFGVNDEKDAESGQEEILGVQQQAEEGVPETVPEVVTPTAVEGRD